MKRMNAPAIKEATKTGPESVSQTAMAHGSELVDFLVFPRPTPRQCEPMEPAAAFQAPERADHHHTKYTPFHPAGSLGFPHRITTTMSTDQQFSTSVE
jgi:hypothetical protein